jgi:hypothetical protein
MPGPSDGDIQSLVEAIQRKLVIRLVYRRQADEVVSIHEVAPVDIRPGWSPRTAKLLYLWGWCFAENKLEMHLVHRIEKAILTESTFDPKDVLSKWPREGWPIPETWEVPREW